ncbi:hypothetical protein JN09_000672 [Acholeplasma morum]|uniref:hypothetical protein n=1 Tax=Paracholeplasma morum TaxID=264637 RepID=UPI00195B5850|nr:hypothetical protein [Paracholeplasma morum]MBM7453346.1 hypothetical protein [Paracholeplasma morum]
MKYRYDLNDFQKIISKGIQEAETKEFSNYFYHAFYQGNRNLYQRQDTERKKFDETWISTIESFFPSIDRITRNMRSAIKYEEEILPIEKIKRVGSTAIKHLSSHTNFIREIDEDGDVVAQKLLSDLSETEFGIYENRFIMTLVFRLRDYTFERIKIIKQGLYANRKTRLNVESQFEFGDASYNIQFNVEQNESIVQRKTDDHNIMVLEKAERLYKLISNLTNSTFIKTLKHYKPVTPPIVKTQIILKNTDFKNAYLLWLYLDKTFQLEYTLEASSRQKRFKHEYIKQLDQATMLLLSTLLVNDPVEESKDSYMPVKYKETKPKILQMMPDEVEVNPDVYVIERQPMNEFYLSKMRQILTKQVQETYNVENKEPIKVYLREALEDATLITNSLYESFFKYNTDGDIFSRMIIEDDPEKALLEAYEKQRVSTIVREVKQKDFQRAIELEKKWNTVLLQKQEALLAKEAETSEERILKLIEEEKKKYDKETRSVITKAQREHQIEIRKQRQELQAFRKKLNDELKAQRQKLKEAEKKRIEKERLLLKKQKEKEKAKLLKQKEKEAEAKKKAILKQKAMVEKKHQVKLKELATPKPRKPRTVKPKVIENAVTNE